MAQPSKPRLVVVAGETGSGKTSLALELAAALGGAVVNADSIAFYRRLDIGSAKPTLEERSRAPHHLFDILDPDEHFDAHAYMELARPLIRRLWDSGVAPIAAGGAGLYLRSLCKGLFEGPKRDEAFRRSLKALEDNGQDLHRMLQERDPEAAARIMPRDRVRTVRALEVLHQSGESIVAFQRRHALKDRPFETLSLVMDVGREELDMRLRERVERMFRDGLVEEAARLLEDGYSPSHKPLKAIGYLETFRLIAGGISLEEAKEAVYTSTRRLAKRQRTWLRRQLPEGVRVRPALSEALPLVLKFLGREA
jgi:tRNA dimethylallyltransferase